MDALPASLPLPDDQLPESIRRFAAASAPAPARMMAARGLVPVKGDDLVVLLLQLAHSSDAAAADAAKATLSGLPEGVLLSSCASLAHPVFLDALADAVAGKEAALEAIAMNHATHDATIARLARTSSEHLSEVIATNQQRLLKAPEIIENLYKNKHTRMSTADRLIELAARNGVELPGIPAFQYHVEAIQGQLIPEPDDEPLPGDQIFAEAVAADGADADAVERPGDEEGEEQVRERWKPLAFRIRDMTTAEKIRFAIVGDAAARALLVRDPKKLVFMAAITSPAMTDLEATNIAHSKEVSVDVLRYIGNRKEWLKSYDIKRALVFNPKTPMDISIRFLNHLHQADLKGVSQSRGVPSQLKTMARNRLEQREQDKNKKDKK
ncbi:MAG: hypothetical protein U0230_25925 [Polyangiales bacterium]